MVASNFPHDLALVRASEGGNDDDKDDPGGRTSRGVTQREYNAACQLNGWPQGDVWKATEDQINHIYHDQYWEPWCDKFPAGLDYLFFDECVNNGQHEAAILLQRGLGVEADGHIGVATLAAIAKCDTKTVIIASSEHRRSFYKQLKTFWKYGRGWLSRVDRVQNDALAMVGNK